MTQRGSAVAALALMVLLGAPSGASLATLAIPATNTRQVLTTSQASPIQASNVVTLGGDFNESAASFGEPARIANLTENLGPSTESNQTLRALANVTGFSSVGNATNVTNPNAPNPSGPQPDAVQTLQNGGTGGGGYDTAADRGKYFGSAPSGTITSVCVYTSTSGETVNIGVKPNHDNAADTFTESITTSVAGGWTCKSVSHTWTASTLFIRRTGGTGHVGWDASSP